MFSAPAALPKSHQSSPKLIRVKTAQDRPKIAPRPPKSVPVMRAYACACAPGNRYFASILLLFSVLFKGVCMCVCVSRSPQDRPRAPQDRPRPSPDRPRSLQDRPRAPQDCPETRFCSKKVSKKASKRLRNWNTQVC